MINQLNAILEISLPSEFQIFQEGGSLIVRDMTLIRGRGYTITVTNELGQIEARFDFESFAGKLAAYSSKSIANKLEILKQLVSKSHQLQVRVVRQSIENIFSSDSRAEDIWWLSLYCQLGDDHRTDYLLFADILLGLIFLILPYEWEGDTEGKNIEEINKVYERSKVNRAICLAFHGYDCMACGINMRRLYSGLTNNFIHVHHLNPMALAGVNNPDPIRDMVPLCPNCHSVAHLRNPPYLISELKTMIKQTL